MTLSRYVKSPEQLARAAENIAELLPGTAKQLVVYDHAIIHQRHDDFAAAMAG